MAFEWVRLKVWVSGEVLSAADLNAEFNRGVNAYTAAFDPTSGHTHDGSAGHGPVLSYLQLSDRPTDKNAYVFSKVGSLSTGTDVSPLVIPVFEAMTLTQVLALVRTAPVGANIIIDINDDGTSIWNSGANRLNIPDGSTSVVSTTTINNPSVAALSKLTLDVDQVGSVTPGADLAVLLVYTVTL